MDPSVREEVLRELVIRTKSFSGPISILISLRVQFDEDKHHHKINMSLSSVDDEHPTVARIDKQNGRWKWLTMAREAALGNSQRQDVVRAITGPHRLLEKPSFFVTG